MIRETEARLFRLMQEFAAKRDEVGSKEAN